MNTKALVIAKVFLCLILLIQPASGIGLDPAWKKAIVLIEKADTTREGKDTLVVLGTGFVVWHYGDSDTRILLTAKHVLAGRDSVFLRFNKKSQYVEADGVATITQLLYLRDGHKNLWTAHPDSQVDLGGTVICVDTLADVRAFGFSLFKPVVDEGEDVLFIGFPLGLTGIKKNYPIIRTGMVALKTHEGIGGEDVFLIDAQVFAGNSGSPVFLKPAPLPDKDTVQFSIAYFIGIIKGHIEDPEPHIIRNNKLALYVNLTENSGLGLVIPAKRVVELLELLWGKTVEEILPR